VSTLGNFVWSIADQLRGIYKPHQYGDVILPMTILRRLDCMLDASRDEVLALAAKETRPEILAVQIRKTAGLSFFNTSVWSLKKLAGDPDGLQANLIDYLAHFSANIDVFDGQPQVRLCNYTDVYKNDSVTGALEFMSATATPEQINRFRLALGDTLITKDSETADDIGIPAYVAYEAPDLVCGYHLAIVRPDPTRTDPRFVYWVLSSQPTLRQWAVLASGVTRVGIRSGDLSKASIPLPPLQLQCAIANFLDRETAQIDTLIAKQEQLIATLRERRNAVVDRTVWRGLAATSLAPTGIDPAPQAPAHWLVTRNNYLLAESTALSTQDYEELLSVSHVTGVTPRSERNVTMFESESLDGYRIVEPDDLVINTMWAWMGRPGRSRGMRES